MRYEDLLATPDEVVDRSLKLMGLTRTAETEAFLPKIQDATAGSYHARKQVRHYVENHARRIGRFRENLTPEQAREVEEVCRETLVTLGYSIDADV